MNEEKENRGSFYKRISEMLLTQSSGPYAGRSTMFVGGIILFFCFIIIIEKRGTGETPWLAYLFGAFGIYDLISGYFELQKQKKYEAQKELEKLEEGKDRG